MLKPNAISGVPAKWRASFFIFRDVKMKFGERIYDVKLHFLTGDCTLPNFRFNRELYEFSILNGSSPYIFLLIVIENILSTRTPHLSFFNRWSICIFIFYFFCLECFELFKMVAMSLNNMKIWLAGASEWSNLEKSNVHIPVLVFCALFKNIKF